MNGTTPRIEIIAPFTAAFEWMKTMLFKPFDLAKWLTVAFAAFIGGNWGPNFRIGRSWNFGDWNYRFTKHSDFPTDWDFGPWLIALLVGIGLFAFALAIVWMWVSSRGRFIFTDCVVRNRGAISEPWREYRREGNSFFLFSLAVAFGAIVLLVIVALILWVPIQVLFGNKESGAGIGIFVILFIGVGLIWLVLTLFFALVSTFMVPVMYRRRCSAMEAFVDVSKLIFANPGPVILFVLFGIALLIALGVAGTIIACLTCCIGAFPYISTVLLLPGIVCLAAYKLLFLRQFGDPYDVWATVAEPVQTTETLPPPPASA